MVASRCTLLRIAECHRRRHRRRRRLILLPCFSPAVGRECPNTRVRLCRYWVQVSDWGRRPLSEQQLLYAALDAHAAVLIFRGMGQLHHPFGTRQGLARHAFSVDTRQGPAARRGGLHAGERGDDEGDGRGCGDSDVSKGGTRGSGGPSNGSLGSTNNGGIGGHQHPGARAGENGSSGQAAGSRCGGSKGADAPGHLRPPSPLGTSPANPSGSGSGNGSGGISATGSAAAVLRLMRPIAGNGACQRRALAGWGAVPMVRSVRPARRLLPRGVVACAVLVPSLLRLLRPCPHGRLARAALFL